ncbi:LacI family DNA-binding transcriptional regulator [Arthrobacter sp. A2-55]|uniref:LacI family DNA-binding transcriptional regulator n=1 Tax=Arthrobacter sp. A2-55 TaxID=2897337 RepID=UPI0021CDAB41|nr:LacI family DNA-binding transcriptional regulator [Arthrobacter sp. A2-55]MCU6480352.1 LacI family transcriptional regulator [Arthrobacter sp. A2-55]
MHPASMPPSDGARPPRITAAMVAARAGVSTATVSLVTSGKTAGRVSTDNIAKVEQAVSELGYVVDGLGSSLARGRSNIVILVAPDVSNPFFARVIDGVRSEIGAAFQLLLSVTEAGQMPTPAEVRTLLSLRPAGLLVDAPSAEFLAALPAAGPMVLLDTAGVESAAPSVNFDVAAGAVLLADHLAGLGHTTVAYLDSTTGTETFRVRREAFCRHARTLGMEVAAQAGTTIDVSAAAQAFAGAWPQWQRQGVTAVVCCTDTHAYGVLQEARVARLDVPGQLAVTGFDDLPYSETSSPGLTTVRLPAAELGRAAGRQLLRLLAGEELDGPGAAGRSLTLDSELVVRGSTAGSAAPGP